MPEDRRKAAVMKTKHQLSITEIHSQKYDFVKQDSLCALGSR